MNHPKIVRPLLAAALIVAWAASADGAAVWSDEEIADMKQFGQSFHR
jgi:hypothetical protein